jgi:hypothetical protein
MIPPGAGALAPSERGDEDDMELLCAAQRRRKERSRRKKAEAKEASAPSVDALSTGERYQ